MTLGKPVRAEWGLSLSKPVLSACLGRQSKGPRIEASASRLSPSIRHFDKLSGTQDERNQVNHKSSLDYAHIIGGVIWRDSRFAEHLETSKGKRPWHVLMKR
jgi:hypothetical protein